MKQFDILAFSVSFEQDYLRAAPLLPALLVAALIPATTTFAQAPALGDSVTMPVQAIDHGHCSSIAFYAPEKDLLPESVAWDVKDGAFYVGSTRKGKVVRVDRDGNATDFIARRQDGLWQVIGIKIHPLRRVLWVCSFNGENLEGFRAGDGRGGGVFCFNLDTGKLIRKWRLEVPGEVHAFNDLVLTRGNDAYITHEEGVANRLPTEAEWEYACRAGTTTPFHTGDTIRTDQANYDGNFTYANGKKGEFRETTTDAGRFPPNAWGLHDLHGNVWEWCADWYGAYPQGEARDPTGPATGEKRIVRGGCWINYPAVCRSANRGNTVPVSWNFNFGFRVARAVERK